MAKTRNGSDGIWWVDDPDAPGFGTLGYAERQGKHCGRTWYTAHICTCAQRMQFAPVGGGRGTLFPSLSAARQEILSHFGDRGRA